MTDTPSSPDSNADGDEPTWTGTRPLEHADPAAWDAPGQGAPETSYSQVPPVPERPRRGRATFAASVVAASLLVGAGAGVGGAAAWDHWSTDGTTSSTVSGAATASPVADASAAPAAEGSVEQVAAAVLPSVVKIDVVGSQEAGSGSGIVLSDDGKILTNNHVVEVAGQGGSITVLFNDGTTAKATIVGTDPVTDTAVIQAEGVSGLTPATIGHSDDLRVGQQVVAIGSPYGLDSTVTSGIVSALDRPVDVGSTDDGSARVVYPAIQTDAAINPGNSGGPLVNLRGQVVGIDASIQTASSGSSDPFSQSTESGGSIGLGFAIPIDEVWPVIQQMLDGQTPTHAQLGVSVSDLAADGSDGLLGVGAKIEEVSDGSAAADAGLKSGDVITKVDDTVITDADALVATVRSYRPGDKVTVTYERGGDERTTTLDLGSDAETQQS